MDSMGSLIKHRFKPQGGVFNWMSKGENKNNPMESLACSWLVNLPPARNKGLIMPY